MGTIESYTLFLLRVMIMRSCKADSALARALAHPTVRRRNEAVSAKSLFSAAIFNTDDVFTFRDALNDDPRVLSSAENPACRPCLVH